MSYICTNWFVLTKESLRYVILDHIQITIHFLSMCYNQSSNPRHSDLEAGSALPSTVNIDIWCLLTWQHRQPSCHWRRRFLGPTHRRATAPPVLLGLTTLQHATQCCLYPKKNNVIRLKTILLLITTVTQSKPVTKHMLWHIKWQCYSHEKLFLMLNA